MSIEIKRSDKYVDYNISATNNRGYITIDTSDWINKPWMFYELPSLKFEIYTETNGELVKYQNFTREIRTYNPVYSPLGVLNVTIDIRNVPEEFILRITPIFDNDAVAARNMLVENGIEGGDIWGSDQDVPTQSFDLDIEFIECDGEYIPPVQPTHEETITGVPPITFDGSIGEPLVSWTILGNCSQTGTPTPDNPVMPEFVGARTGNLFDVSLLANNMQLDNTTGLPVSYPGRIASPNPVDVSQYSTVTISYVTATTIKAMYTIFSNNVLVERVIAVSSGTAIDVSNADKMYVCFYSTWGGNIDTSSVSDIMLNSGSTALPYEPYGYKIPLTCAGQTVPVYLGQTPTVRRVKKLVLTGEEQWQFFSDVSGAWQFYINDISLGGVAQSSCMSNIATYGATATTRQRYDYGCYLVTAGNGVGFQMKGAKDTFTDVSSWKSYLAAQYAARTPVTVWYVLAEPTTGIVNEPLCKIGTYADELSSEDVGVSIPTIKGQNTLTVDTPIQPSEMTITYIKEGQ